MDTYLQDLTDDVGAPSVVAVPKKKKVLKRRRSQQQPGADEQLDDSAYADTQLDQADDTIEDRQLDEDPGDDAADDHQHHHEVEVPATQPAKKVVTRRAKKSQRVEEHIEEAKAEPSTQASSKVEEAKAEPSKQASSKVANKRVLKRPSAAIPDIEIALATQVEDDALKSDENTKEETDQKAPDMKKTGCINRWRPCLEGQSESSQISRDL